jgi:hypothetical protein
MIRPSPSAFKTPTALPQISKRVFSRPNFTKRISKSPSRSFAELKYSKHSTHVLNRPARAATPMARLKGVIVW